MLTATRRAHAAALAGFCFGLALSLSAFAARTPEECSLCWQDCIARFEQCRADGGGTACFRLRQTCVNACGCRG
ncbi:hypothetical protein J5226_13770 [Lysobacter sp. K5869]|uniref:hypothetical protein n=1 Tax=Lysobacter sp. K5869 TaxID=2820808 RepID=UPI001C06186F|nr:hypothetical protein [Lysobacter sp. K5869]QWP74735.1 hypothetical protein J5226_13770 [Lysobacter sp. K5869]